jgi:hypothetical protein
MHYNLSLARKNDGSRFVPSVLSTPTDFHTAQGALKHSPLPQHALIINRVLATTHRVN